MLNSSLIWDPHFCHHMKKMGINAQAFWLVTNLVDMIKSVH
jgi:hypothetical protein